ncbi:histidine phosphatase superfamily [Pelagophyceae sp. CCMP2097]|nr:histidine phosphatase superfamily [Pelagophyceae sp. CCMP2097]
MRLLLAVACVCGVAGLGKRPPASSDDELPGGTMRLGSKRLYTPFDLPALAPFMHRGLPPTQECPTKYLAAVSRHGARFPTAGKWRLLEGLLDEECGASARGAEAAAWCTSTRAALASGAAPGDLAPQGRAELREMAQLVAARFNATHLGAAFPLAEARVWTTSSQRTQDSCASFVLEAWPGFPGGAALCAGAVNDALLRLGSRGKVGADFGDARLVACQLDATLRPSQVADAAWGYACGDLLRGSAVAVVAEDEEAHRFFARGALGPELRSSAGPLLREIHAALAGRPARLDLFFTHDSTLAPLVALVGLFNVSDLPPAQSQAAKLFPFASRLFVDQRECGPIVLEYNGAALRIFDDLAHFEATYAQFLHLGVPCGLGDVCTEPRV